MREWRSRADAGAVRRHAPDTAPSEPWSGEHNETKDRGCVPLRRLRAELFGSDAKFESGSGWPSFFQPAAAENVETEERTASLFMTPHRGALRDVRVATSGHVFPDGPNPTGLRYCINSVCLALRA